MIEFELNELYDDIKVEVVELTQKQKDFLDLGAWVDSSQHWFHLSMPKKEYSTMVKEAGGRPRLNEHFIRVLQHGLAKESLYTNDLEYRMSQRMCKVAWAKVKLDRSTSSLDRTHLVFQCDRVTARLIELAALNYPSRYKSIGFSTVEAITAIVRNGREAIKGCYND